MAYIAQVPILTVKLKGRKRYLWSDDIVYIEKFEKTAKVHNSSQTLVLNGIEEGNGNFIICTFHSKDMKGELKDAYLDQLMVANRAQKKYTILADGIK